MAVRSLAHPAHPVPFETKERIRRALKLYEEHGDEIVQSGPREYRVPGCRGGRYTVKVPRTGEANCSCKDYRRRQTPCKHCYLATLYIAKRNAAILRKGAEASRQRRARLAGVGA
jgi:hypothetical protein